MRQPAHQTQSFLFTIRLWHEELSHGQKEWRGKVRHVTSGQEYYFRDWPALSETLQTMLSDFDRDPDLLNSE